jgi:methanogenic corrinoid protein MtbC1
MFEGNTMAEMFTQIIEKLKYFDSENEIMAGYGGANLSFQLLHRLKGGRS